MLFLLYLRAYRIRKKLGLSDYEKFYTRSQKIQLIIMFTIPLLSIVLILFAKQYSSALAAVIGGFTYSLYGPGIAFWLFIFKRDRNNILNSMKLDL